MIFKFIEMLYEMYGNDYEDAIESFAEEIFQNGRQDLRLDDLFIGWANSIEQAKEMKK